MHSLGNSEYAKNPPRARQKELDRLVAVKILPPGVSADPAFAERFTHEARALEEVGQSDVIVHVVDASHPDPGAQLATVRDVIGEIGRAHV